MAYFDPPYGPGEPPRFVARAAAMAGPTAALAPDTRHQGPWKRLRVIRGG
jgi:hypothetical protein